MKKFEFSFRAVLIKREQEEKASLRELAIQVGKVNALHLEEQTVRANLRGWQEGMKRPKSPTESTEANDPLSSPVLADVSHLRLHMQDFLKQLKPQIAEAQEAVRVCQQKFLQRRQETRKIELLKEQQLKKWKRAKVQDEQLQLQEQYLQSYMIENTFV